MIYNKKCKICNQNFSTSKPNQSICNNEHYTNCVICGNPVLLKSYSISKYLKGHQFTCSKKCSVELMKKTNMQKYGATCSVQNKDIREKIINKNKEKYGGISPFCNKEIQQKSLEKRNNKTACEKQLIKDKVKETNKIRYGNENYNNPEKFKTTMQQRYGVNYTNESVELKQKQQNTMLAKYGVTSTFCKGKLRNKCNDIILKKYGTKSFITSEKTKQTNLDRYKVPYYCMTEECRKLAHTPISQNNLKFKEALQKFNYDIKLEYTIQNYQYDLQFNNILIEIDPTFTHNSTKGPCFNKSNNIAPKDKYYHRDKSNKAREAGFHCIHIFDWDDKDKIINLLKPKENIYARCCDIREVSSYDCADFLNKHHLQNNCRGQIIRIGLYNNNELIQVMTFGKPRYNKKYEWELLRLCTRTEYKILGGSNKLFSYFVKKYQPKSIISYCDLAKFTGDVYERLGFKLLKNSKPSCHWSKYNLHITNNLLLQRGYDQLFNTNYGKGISNRDLMIKNGWQEVYDCGQATYIFENK